MQGEGSRPDENTLADHRGFVEALARRLVYDQHLADDNRRGRQTIVEILRGELFQRVELPDLLSSCETHRRAERRRDGAPRPIGTSGGSPGLARSSRNTSNRVSNV